MPVEVVASADAPPVESEMHLVPCEVRRALPPPHNTWRALPPPHNTRRAPHPDFDPSLMAQIMHTGTARVSTYFKVADDATTGLRTSAFRGRRLVGRVAQLPVGYRGSVLQDTKEGQVGETEERRWLQKRSFDQLTYWQHDGAPRGHEPFLKAMRFASLADVLHGDCTEAGTVAG